MPQTSESSRRTHEFQQLILTAGIGAEYTEEVEIAMWSKLCTKAAYDAITVLGRYDLGTLRSADGSKQLYLEAMREVFDVGVAAGVKLDPQVLKDLEEYSFVTGDPGIRSSMLQDLEAGKRIEINELSGSVVRHGERLGVATPTHRVATMVLAPIQQLRSEAHAKQQEGQASRL